MIMMCIDHHIAETLHVSQNHAIDIYVPYVIHIDSHRHDSKGKVHSWYGGNCHCHCNPSPLNGGKDISLDVKQIQRLIDATTRISYSQTTIHQKKIIVSLCVCVLKETFEYDQLHVQVDMDHSGSDAFVVVRIA